MHLYNARRNFMAEKTFVRYGAKWADGIDDLALEIACVVKGGNWKSKDGTSCGQGLPFHYRRIQEIIWPEDYHHKWTELVLREILQNTITCVTGGKDTGKTHVALARFGLTDYFCFPEETLIIMSSTTLQAIETRVWGDVKSLFGRAKDRFPWLPGICIDSKRCICTDDLTDEMVVTRDMRKGILCIACKTSQGSTVNISNYVGMKQKRRRHLGDEFQFMSAAMMDSIANMNSGEYKGVFVGNPIGQGDPLDQMSEPVCGWENQPEITTTTCWKNKRFLNSRTVCLYGLDSPNFDEPKNRYAGLINEDSINRVVAGYGKDSLQYWSQGIGVRKAGLFARRVITEDFCRQHKAFEEIIWKGDARKRIASLDAAYSSVGGDRCVLGYGEFGKCVDDAIRLLVHPPVIIPIRVVKDLSAEDQIAQFVKHYCEGLGIAQEDFFYDSTGRGSLGPALARIWGAGIQPVEFGGNPTDRPVSLDTFIFDYRTHQPRLKTCREHYSKFVTELWWTSRLVIESEQVRGLPLEIVQDGSPREWREVAGGKIEIESKKEMKERIGYSPDLYDFFATLVEGGRRRGFQVSKLANEETSAGDKTFWADLRMRAQVLLNRGNLK